MHTVGAKRQLAPLLLASWAKEEPTAWAISTSKEAAMPQAAGKHAARVLPSKLSPRAPLGPSVVYTNNVVSSVVGVLRVFRLGWYGIEP